MPSAAAMARSSGVVMNPRTRSALAPTYTVVTETAALSLRGYCRTTRLRIAWTPAIRITRFTTRASTGRRMNRSVKDFMDAPGGSTVGRTGGHVVLRRQVVVLDHGHAVAELEDAGADNTIPGLEAGLDTHEVAARAARPDELLPHRQLRLVVVFARLRLDHIDGVSVGSAQDGGGRNDYHRLLFRQEDFHASEHAGPEQLLGIVERGLQTHAARLGVKVRIDRRQRAVELPLRIRVGRDAHLHASLEPRQLLLRERKLGIDWRQRLKRDDRFAGVQVLPEVDEADAQAPSERRADGLLLNRSTDVVSVALVLLEGGLGGFQFGLRNHVLGAEAAFAGDVEAAQLFLRLKRMQLGRLGGGVQSHQQSAIGHHRAGFKGDLAGDAGDVRGDGHTLHGGDGGDGGKGVLPFVLAHNGSGDAFRRRDKAFAGGYKLLELEGLHPGQAAEDEKHDENSERDLAYHE